jgi:hypothetical protein
MRGLVFAIVFWAFSLLVAEGIMSLIMRLGFVGANEYDLVHSVIMLAMLACYLAIAPCLERGSSVSKRSTSFGGKR